MFNPSRDEVRQFFIEAWRKHGAGEIPTALETLAAQWIAEHAEYHTYFENDLRAGAPVSDFKPEQGQTNPYLHLSMHLSISEQVSIDQPPGIRLALEQLAHRLGSLHEAHHQVMECLGEMLWRSQRDGLPPDGARYIECIRQRASS